MPRPRSRAANAERENRAMQAGCSAVSDQFARFRAWAVQELARCPDDGTAPVRRDELIHSLAAINREIEIMRRIAGRKDGHLSAAASAQADGPISCGDRPQVIAGTGK